MDMDLVREFGGLIAEKRKLDDQLRATKDRIASLEPSLLNQLMEEQIDRLPVVCGDEKITLYIHKQLWAKPKEGDRDRVTATLKRCGLSDFVQETYNSNSLSAYVRERLGNGDELQPTLDAVLHLDEVVSVRGRRSPVSSESKSAKAMKTLRR